MEITAGDACGLRLADLSTSHGVRPTSVRARRAFFDSIGALRNLVFADLFSGSGCMGLEAASRGASYVYFAEERPENLEVIRRNVRRIERTGITTKFIFLPGTLPGALRSSSLLRRPDFVFADPPYAKSMECMTSLTSDPVFCEWAAEAKMYWEFPDFICPLQPPSAPWRLTEIRMLGPTKFLLLKQMKV